MALSAAQWWLATADPAALAAVLEVTGQVAESFVV
jgi:hypothetical protein